MARYVEDLVQNIYTKCDMSGLDKLNQGLRQAIVYSKTFENALRDAQRVQKNGYNFHARAINTQKINFENEKNNIVLAKERVRLEELQQKTADRVANAKDRQRARTEELQVKSDRRLAEFNARQDALAKRRNARMAKHNNLWGKAIKLAMSYYAINKVRDIVRTGADLQMLQRSIQGLTGSGQDWEFIEQQASKFGVSLNTVATGYRNFYSSAKMAGFNSKQIQGMYGDLLLSTRSIGASSEQTGGALLALEQMISKGTVSMEELRRQLGNSIPGAFEIGAKAMNMTTQQFNAFVKSGKLASNVFVPRFIEQLKKTYAGGWKDVEQTVSVAWGRLGVAWEKLTLQLMHGEGGKVLARGLNELAKLMESPEFKQLVDVLGKIFALVVKILTIAVRLLTFAIRHIRTVVILLGSAGLTGVIAQNIGLLTVLGRILRVVFSAHAIKGIKMLAGAFALVNVELLGISAAVVAVIAALLVMQDLWVAVRHPDWESVIGGWAGKSQFSQPKVTGGMIFGDNSQTTNRRGGIAGAFQSLLWSWQDKYGVTGGASGIDNITPSGIYTPPTVTPIIPSGSAGYKGTFPSYGDLTKTFQKTATVTIGDINVYSNASNPQAVAEEVNRQLIAMLTSQSVMIDARGIV